MSGRLSLKEQIAQLEETAPVDFDPEDTNFHGEELDKMDSGATREHYIDVGPSSLRKSLHSIADPKYEGTRTSRKALMEGGSDEDIISEEEGDEDELDEDEDEDEGDFEDDEDVSFGGNQELEGSDEEPESGSEPDEEDEVSGDEDEEEEEEEESGDDRQQTRQSREQVDDMSAALKKTKQEDLTKGRAVKSQMDLWDNLLDTRIRLQKSVVQTNVLPLASDLKLAEVDDIQDVVMEALSEASHLLEDIFKLQESLITENDIVKPPPKKRRKVEDVSERDLDFYREYFLESTEDAAALEQALHPYSTRTLSKWSNKIQAVAPSVLLPSNRGAFSKGAQNLKTATQLMDETLTNDRDKLLTRTQTLRTKIQRIGAPPHDDTSDPVVDAEVYDDTDFYQKLLRDIIDSRSGKEGQEDWLALQKQKKAKKKVDTKASKGRKIRYQVHEKLQNFMVPVPVAGAWHDEQIDELFSSLLGKGFENLQMNSEKAPDENINLSGFKVFG